VVIQIRGGLLCHQLLVVKAREPPKPREIPVHKYLISFLCVVKMKGCQTGELALLLIADISTAVNYSTGLLAVETASSGCTK